MENTIAGVDLAKDVIQVCVFTNKKVRLNTEMIASEFINFFANSKPLTIVFEVCGTSCYTSINLSGRIASLRNHTTDD